MTPLSDSRLTRAGDTGGATTKTFPPSDHEAVTKAARGVADRTATTLSFDAGTRTFTITPVSGAWSYHIAGRRYIKSAAESIVIADTSGEHWLHYDGATLTDSVNPSHAALKVLIEDKVRVGLVYWNATDGAASIAADERHGTGMPGVTQEWLHEHIGAVHDEGLDLTGYTLDSDADADVQFELSDGRIHDEDLHFDIEDGNPANQYEQQLLANAEVPILYRDDIDGSWTEDAATDLPYKLIAPGDRLAYNEDDGDGTFSQVEVTDNKFVGAFLYATTDWRYPVKMVQGQHEHADKRTAVEEISNDVLALGDLPNPEMVLLYAFTMQTKDTFVGGTNKCKIVAITDMRRAGLGTGGLLPPVGAHAILSDTHSDSVSAAVVRGALQVGNATPAWGLFSPGAAGTFLRCAGAGADLTWDTTVVTATANLTDNALVRGHGGGHTVQTSLAILSDTGGLTLADDLDMAGNGVTFLDAVNDPFGNEQLAFAFVAVAVNYVQITNAATGSGPIISANGTDANVDLLLSTQGTGKVKSLDHFDVTGDITLTGTVDGVDIAGTVVTADANLTDDALVRGKGGALGSQTSLAILSDAGALSGLTQLDVDNLRLDENTISGTAGGAITLQPFANQTVNVLVAGAATANQRAINMANSAWNAAMIDTRTSFTFWQAYTVGGDIWASAMITAGTETNWTAVAATQDAYMAFYTTLNGVVGEKVRINSLGQVGINTDEPCSRSSANLMLDIRREGATLRAGIGLYTHEGANANRGSTFFGARSRGTDGTPVIVNNGDRLFAFVSQGYDGVLWRTSANIIFEVDGAPAAGAVPTSIGFWTGAGGATTERLRIQSDGDIHIDGGTAIFIRDPQISLSSSADGQFDIDADGVIDMTAPVIRLTCSTWVQLVGTVYVSSDDGIDYYPGADIDVDIATIQVTGIPRFWWDESVNAFAMTHRLSLPEGVQTKYATDDVSDPPTDAELDAAFGDPTVVGPGFVGILDDNGAGLYCYICWTTGTAGEWFYVAGTKAA